jgi:hypothetical protein
MAVGGRGKCPGAPRTREGVGKMELEKGKIADRKGTVKAVWQKTGMALKKKKKGHKFCIFVLHFITKYESIRRC